MSPPRPKHGILFVGHGSRDAQAIAEVHRFVEAYREAHPGRRVGLGFVELTEPALPEALDAIASQVEEVL
ncbi:MAG TPA: CbiX/SirB N-terminal domain-containing protein, partial [Cystobacter sp.]